MEFQIPFPLPWSLGRVLLLPGPILGNFYVPRKVFILGTGLKLRPWCGMLFIICEYLLVVFFLLSSVGLLCLLFFFPPAYTHRFVLFF